MKHITILIVIILTLTVQMAKAGFFVHQYAIAGQRSTAIAHPINYQLPNEQNKSAWQGKASIALGFAGILFAPLGIFAVLFGVLALTKHQKPKGLIIFALILGILETVFTIFILAAIAGL